VNAAVDEGGARTPRPARKIAERVAFAVALAAAFAFLLWADATGLSGAPAATWLLPVALAVAAGGADEMRRLADRTMAPVPRPLAVGGCSAVVVAAACGAGVVRALPTAGIAPALAAIGWAGGAAALAFVVALVVEIIRFPSADGGGTRRLAATGLILAWVALPVACLVALRVDDGGIPGGARSVVPLASLVAVVKGGDVAAYAVGSSLGRRRMAPALSPGKTWEGAWASVAASVAIAWMLLAAPSAPHPWGGWPVYGLAVGTAGILGDLGESLLKREAGTKDSGRSLGPLGGVLDLVDSLLVAAPVAWVLWRAADWIGPGVA
jgi:phosphatidate cytidylyltransferase